MVTLQERREARYNAAKGRGEKDKLTGIGSPSTAGRRPSNQKEQKEPDNSAAAVRARREYAASLLTQPKPDDASKTAPPPLSLPNPLKFPTPLKASLSAAPLRHSTMDILKNLQDKHHQTTTSTHVPTPRRKSGPAVEDGGDNLLQSSSFRIRSPGDVSSARHKQKLSATSHGTTSHSSTPHSSTPHSSTLHSSTSRSSDPLSKHRPSRQKSDPKDSKPVKGRRSTRSLHGHEK